MLSYFGVVFMLFLALIARQDGKSLWEMQCATPTRYVHQSGFALFQGMFFILNHLIPTSHLIFFLSFPHNYPF
jgi:hypothetical protein